MSIVVREVEAGERPALRNLVKMYCYEWSQYNLMDVDEQGEYPFEKYLVNYFDRPRRFCYFALVDGVLAGFALLDDDFFVAPDGDYSMGEFFVMMKYRRQHVGQYMAKFLFEHYRGRWQIGFHPRNIPSVHFWPAIVNEYTHGQYRLVTNCEGLHFHDGTYGSVLLFDNH